MLRRVAIMEYAEGLKTSPMLDYAMPESNGGDVAATMKRTVAPKGDWSGWISQVRCYFLQFF